MKIYEFKMSALLDELERRGYVFDVQIDILDEDIVYYVNLYIHDKTMKFHIYVHYSQSKLNILGVTIVDNSFQKATEVYADIEFNVTTIVNEIENYISEVINSL